MDLAMLVFCLVTICLCIKSQIDTAPKQEWSECPGCKKQVWADWCKSCEDGFCSF